jgi:ATP synthase F1 epsilon subunit
MLVNETVDEVEIPGADGYFGVLPGHTPLLAVLQVGQLWYRQGQEIHYFAVAFGFAEVQPDRVTILAQVAERADEIDLARAEAAKRRAEERPAKRAALTVVVAAEFGAQAPHLHANDRIDRRIVGVGLPAEHVEATFSEKSKLTLSTADLPTKVQVDPIVAYGQPQSAHMHNAFGGFDFSPFSTANIPIAPGHEDDPGYKPPAYDTNPTYGDWSIRWYPEALLSGVALTPQALKVTYQSPSGTPVAVPPYGVTFVTGSPAATSTPAHVRFTCGDLDGPGYPEPVDCTSIPGGVVTGEITFHDCYDGGGSTPNADGHRTFDTPAGISPSHFSYSVNGACPPGTVPCVPGTLMAQLVTRETWIDPRTSGPLVNPIVNGVNALTFSSGGPSTYHGDYISRWNHVLGTIVDACLNPASPNGCTNVNNVPIR